MGFLQRVFGGVQPAPALARPSASGTVLGVSFDDPRFRDIVLGATGLYASGAVSVEQAMRNPAVFRSVTLISSAIGMLPLHLIREDTKEAATDHPLDRLLHREPNGWQTAFDFRSLMQLRALTRGDPYALIIRGRDVASRREKVIRLVPLDPVRMTAAIDETTWQMTYRYRPKDVAERVYTSRDVFHLRGTSINGVNGVSLIQQAADAVRLALDADLAVRSLFRNGSFIGGSLQTPNGMSQEAYDRLKVSWTDRHSGAGNAGSTPILEAGVKFEVAGASAKDAQSNETRARQVEEIARVFGIPRPLLMVDETSWGSGIDALGQFFVRYALGPWFEAWQQAIERSLLEETEKALFSAKFNYGALIRGSMKDQGEFFAKALGAGGQQAWMTPNEIRNLLDMPRHADGDSLSNPMLGHNGGPALTE